MAASVVITIPVYKPSLNLLEQFSIDYLLSKASHRALKFIGPAGLDTRYYKQHFPAIGFEFFEGPYFASIAGYNNLLLDAGFYRRFENFDFMLIHQTDALLFKDDLDAWMSSGYDYLGAPWPMGMTLNFGEEDARFFGGHTFHAFVGNGGFSLRHIKNTIAVLTDASRLLGFWRNNRLNEDCYFSFAGLLTENFNVPSPDVASLFSLEQNPAEYFNTNNNVPPTGCHAWLKYDLPFWQKVISMVK